ncbi:FIG022606: AAA ATPase, partial [hydrothermal vent metagenome]
MYEAFYNLKVKPFELVPSPDFLFLSRSHRKALTYLKYGITEKVGFMLLTGEVGSGKTTLIRNLVKGLDSNIVLSKIFNTKVSSEQLISLINEDFGLDVNGKDKISLLRELNDFLIEQYAKKHNPILVIDEAQNLTPELLEEVRMLSNLETDDAKLLQIVLVGQPELKKVLARPELRQLRQRISISCHIYPITRAETEEYIFHRLEVAGNR